MNKSLTKEEVNNLLRNSGRPDPWPSHDNLVRVAKAVKGNSPIVVFTNGVEFSINYANIDRWEAVFIKPSTGHYAPCGYLSLDKLRELIR